MALCLSSATYHHSTHMYVHTQRYMYKCVCTRTSNTSKLLPMHTALKQTHTCACTSNTFTETHTCSPHTHMYTLKTCNHVCSHPSNRLTYTHMHTGAHALSSSRLPFLVSHVYSQLPLPALRMCWGYLMVCIPNDFCNEHIKQGATIPCGFFATRVDDKCPAYFSLEVQWPQ